MTGLSVRPSRRQRWTSIAWNRRPSPSHGASMRSVAPAAPTTRWSGACMNGGTSIQPSVPEMRAEHDSPVRMAALITPRPPAGVVEHGGHLLVDPGLPDVAVGHHPVGVAEHHGHQLGGVDPEVEQRAAAEGDVEQAVGRVDVPPEPEVGLDEARVADPLLAEQVTQHGVGGQEPAPHRLHEEQPARAGVRHHGAALQAVEGERLLAQHGLAGGEEAGGCPARGRRGARRRTRRRRRGRRRGPRRRRASAGCRAARRRTTAAVGRAGGDGDDLGVVELRQPGGERVGDVSGGGDAPADGVGHDREPTTTSVLAREPARATSVWTHVQSGVRRRGRGRLGDATTASPVPPAGRHRRPPVRGAAGRAGHGGLRRPDRPLRGPPSRASRRPRRTRTSRPRPTSWPRCSGAACAPCPTPGSTRRRRPTNGWPPRSAPSPTTWRPSPRWRRRRPRPCSGPTPTSTTCATASAPRCTAGWRAALATGGPGRPADAGRHRPPRRRRPGRPGRRRRPHAGRRAAAGRHGPHGLRRPRRPARHPLPSRDRRPPMTERPHRRPERAACGSAPTTTPSTRTPTPPTPACATRRRCSTTPTRTSGRCRGTPT